MNIYYRESRWLYLALTALTLFALLTKSILNRSIVVIGFLLIMIFENEGKPQREKKNE